MSRFGKGGVPGARGGREVRYSRIRCALITELLRDNKTIMAHTHARTPVLWSCCAMQCFACARLAWCAGALESSEKAGSGTWHSETLGERGKDKKLA